MTRISIKQLFDQNQHLHELRLDLADGALDRFVVQVSEGGAPGLIGFLNLVNANQIQVLGPAEVEFLESLNRTALRQALETLFSPDLAVLLVSNDLPVPGFLRRAAKRARVPVITTPNPGAGVIDGLRHYLVQSLAEMTSLHGVFMEVQGMGILITGASSIGKSELALELISRGHHLIADDVVDFYHVAPGTLEGRCPPLLQDFLEVRGLGILNIRALFGETAVRPKKNLKLIVHLDRFRDGDEPNRLTMTASTEAILGVNVPKVCIPVTAGTNIAVLLEVAVRNHILRLRGINSAEQFIERQQREIARNGEDVDPDARDR